MRSLVSCVEQSACYAHYVASPPIPGTDLPDWVRVDLTFPADSAWYLDSRRDLVSLVDEVSPPWPVGCFAVVRQGGSFYQIRSDAGAHFRLRRRDGGLAIGFTLRDRSACGLRLWGDHKLAQSPFTSPVHITVSKIEHLEDAVWVEPFPHSARAVVCLTDHPDWDSVPKASSLCDLFAEHGVRITKGVFPAADPGWEYGPGLDSQEYAAVIDRWFEAGHEIAYHGLGSGMHAPPDLDECLRRIDRLGRYAPETWIDHSCGAHTFARSAVLPGGADLMLTLTARGVKNVWSYADVWQNPALDLHVWHRRSPLSGLGDFLRLARARGPMGPVQLAYLATIPVKNCTGAAQYRRALRKPWSPSEWVDMARNYRLLRELNNEPLYLYEPNGDFPMWRLPGGMMLFDTVLLNHLSLQLSPSNIERLARDNGILVAHTYLGAVQSKGGRNCFRVGREAEFLDAFRDNVEALAALSKQGQVTTLPLRELRRALERHAQSEIKRTTGGWEVHGDVIVSSRTPYRIAGGHMSKGLDGVFCAQVSGAAFLANP